MEQEKDVKKKTSVVTWLVLIVFVIIIAVVVDTASKAEPRVAQTIESSDTRCLSVPANITQRLNEGLNITGGGSVTDLQAVKSSDYESVYFISGTLQGSGLGRDTDLVTFLTNKLDNSGLTFSVDSVSTEFSDWPNITTTNLLGEGVSSGVVMSSDGYDESRKCVSNS
jgi:hypothetical protein